MKRLYGAVVRTQRKELTIIGMSTRNQLTYCLKYDKHLLKGIKKKQKSLPAAISTDWQITNPAAKLRSVSVLTPVWEKHTLKQD